MTLKRIGPFNEDDAGDALVVAFVEDDGTTVVPLTGGGTWTAVWRQHRIGEPSTSASETAMTVSGAAGTTTLTWTAALLATPGVYIGQAKATNGTITRRSRTFRFVVEKAV